MIQRIRVFYNPRDSDHGVIKEMLHATNIPYSMLPTSGPYTLHLIDDKDNSSLALGPTSVKRTLELLAA